jgi:hypothetical protein
VPTNNIKQVIEVVKPKMMLSMFITPTLEPAEVKLEAILKQVKIPLIVSGNPEVVEQIINDKRIVYLSHPDDLINLLKSK